MAEANARGDSRSLAWWKKWIAIDAPSSRIGTYGYMDLPRELVVAPVEAGLTRDRFGGGGEGTNPYWCARKNVSGLLNVFAIPSPRCTFFSDTLPVATAAPRAT